MNLSEIAKAIHDFMQEFRPRADENKGIKNSLHSMELCIQRLVAGTKCSVSLFFFFNILLIKRKCVQSVECLESLELVSF